MMISTDTCSRNDTIGALELASDVRFDDDALLSAAARAAGPTSAPAFCAPTARCVTNAAPEVR